MEDTGQVIIDREAIRRRLESVGVRPDERELDDITQGFSTLSQWNRVVGEMLSPEAEPATAFAAELANE